jgi:hypothetical protein
VATPVPDTAGVLATCHTLQDAVFQYLTVRRTGCMDLKQLWSDTGAVHTHAGLAAQTSALQEAWEISHKDRLLHVLPLHHIHGAVAALHTLHSAGGCVEFQPSFSPDAVWKALQVPLDTRKQQLDSTSQAL